MQRDAWMTQLRQCGLGDQYKGRNTEVENALTDLFRDVVVPFYNGRNPDSIYLRGVKGTIMHLPYVHMKYTCINAHTICTY